MRTSDATTTIPVARLNLDGNEFRTVLPDEYPAAEHWDEAKKVARKLAVAISRAETMLRGSSGGAFISFNHDSKDWDVKAASASI